LKSHQARQLSSQNTHVVPQKRHARQINHSARVAYPASAWHRDSMGEIDVVAIVTLVAGSLVMAILIFAFLAS
jgi:hypothetical protein